MLRIEIFALALSNLNGSFDSPDSKAFKLKNPLLLKTYRPEKKVDSEHFRIFSSVMGGFKAACADVAAKSSGKNHRLTQEDTLRDLLAIYDIKDERAQRKVLLFMQRALNDPSIAPGTPLSWLNEKSVEETAECPIQ